MSPHVYTRPLDRIPEGPEPWYTRQRVGVNTLKVIILTLSKQSQCTTKYTNHSLRATAATRMFCGKVPEKVIAETTGHRSLKALRQYERTQPSIYQAVGSIITDPESSIGGTTEKKIQNGSGLSINQVATTNEETIGDPPLEKKPCIGDTGKSASHAVSGTLNNSTINISYHWSA